MEKIKRGVLKFVRWQYFPLLVLIAFIVGLHLATIMRPDTPLFDEQHYVPDARRIITGEGTLRVENPPLAKLIIAGGIELFGDNPWGWRLPPVIFGVIMLLAFYDICRRLGTSQRTALLAVVLLGLENLTFIHSGIAMQDIYLVSFAMLAFWFYLKGPRWWWASAISIALASLCKFSGFLTAIPIGLHWFLIGYKPNMGNPMPAAPPAPITLPAEAAAPVEAAPLSTDSTITIEEPKIPEAEPIVAPEPPPAPVVIEVVPPAAPPKRTFWQTYSRPIIFIASFLIAPLAFFLLYGVFDWIIWQKYIPYVVWGHWDQGVVGDIKNALSLTDSIKFSYGGAFPARPWEWILSPTGSLYFYGWLFHPQNYENILLPYWYTPSYTGILSPSLWLSGLFVIPVAIWNAFKKNNASIFIVCWIIGTWVVWIPLYLATHRITYIFYYLPTIGAIAMGTALIITYFLRRIDKKAGGFWKHVMMLSVASFLLFHLLSFAVISPLQLSISIPVCSVLLLLIIAYLNFGRRFIIPFFLSAGISALIMRFGLYFWFRTFLIDGTAPWGLPEVSLLWVVSAAVGIVITWVLYLLIQLGINRLRPGEHKTEQPLSVNQTIDLV
jgi:Dolichyl-phosphate-mannose-protein mannosyltransferase